MSLPSDVRVGVEHAISDEVANRTDAPIHLRAALEHERPRACPRQEERREEPRRARSHDDGAHCGGDGDPREGWCGLHGLDEHVFVRNAAHDGRLVLGCRGIERHAKCHHKVDVALVTCVDRASEHAERGDQSRADAQACGRGASQRVLSVGLAR